MPEASSEEKFEHEGLIHDLLRERFQRELLHLEKRGRGANSFVYDVNLLEPPLSALPPSASAAAGFERHVSVLPANVTKLVIKLPNAAALVNESNRVQNEVAAIGMFRSALAESGLAHLVPNVYGWQATEQTSEQGFVNGWIALEHMSGSPLDDALPTFSPEAKKRTLGEIAAILKSVQSYRLPPSIVGYGGFTFGSSGTVITGPTTLPCGGPFHSVPEMHKQMLRKQLEIADAPEAEIVDGWRGSAYELRERLKRFEVNGLAQLVVDNAVDRPTLVHGDLDIHNLLVSSDGSLTALLDYEFAFVGTVLDEYTLSFPRLYGIIGGPWDGGELDKLRRYQLSRFPTELPTSETRGQVDWELAGMFDAALQSAGAQKPQDFACADTYSALIWFYQNVCPPYLMMPRWLARKTSEEISSHKDQVARNLDLYLKMWEY